MTHCTLWLKSLITYNKMSLVVSARFSFLLTCKQTARSRNVPSENLNYNASCNHPNYSTKILRSSFSNLATRYWNNLSNGLRTTSSKEMFRSRIFACHMYLTNPYLQPPKYLQCLQFFICLFRFLPSHLLNLHSLTPTRLRFTYLSI